jgi:hypothetical protein
MTLPGSLIEIIVLLAVVSFGATMLVTALVNSVVGIVPEDRTSEAIGTMLVVRGFGLAIGAQLIAVSLSLFTVASPDGSAMFPAAESYRFTMGWFAATAFGAMLFGLLLPRGRPAAQPAAAAAAD